MILGGGPHQRVFAERFFAGVDVGAVAQNQRHGFRVACPRRGHQDRLALADRRLRVGARVEQQLDHRGVGVGGRERQRGEIVAVGGVDVRAGADEQARDLDRVSLHGPVQRRRAVRLRGVDGPGAPRRLQQRRDRVPIARLDGVHQPLIGAAGGERERGQKREEKQRRSFHIFLL